VRPSLGPGARAWGPKVTTRPAVLLIDDGELNDVARTLDAMDVAYARIAGCEAQGRIAPPLALLISTPAHARRVRRGSPPGADRGRPIRIIASDENSPGMRRKLERLGFQILVRPSAHADVWKLLVERAMRSHERSEERVEVGAPVYVSTGRSRQTATLVDISNRGCRLDSPLEFRAGARMSFEVTSDENDTATRLCGRVIRVLGEFDPVSGATHSAALLFDADMPEADRARLAQLLNRWSRGDACWSPAREPVLPSSESVESPGLTLDDETDPPLIANVEVELQMQPDPAPPARQAGAERRQRPRRAFATPIAATSRGRDRLLVGRDISATGMRIEAVEGLHEGDRLRLALYGPSDMEPLPLRASVVRSDGQRGLALRFEDLSSDLAEKLEKLVACLPLVESLAAGERDPISAVVSQILADE